MEMKPGYKQTEVGVIPEDWDTQRISQVAEANWGNTTITKASYREAGFRAFSASGPDGYLDWFEHDRPAVVLSAIGALCGKTWFATEKWTAIKNTIWIRGDEHQADSRFVFRITGDPIFWPKRGQAQPFISLGDVRDARIPLPPLPEQRAIATALSDVDGLLGGLDRLIAKKRDLKQAAMQQLLTGQTRLPGFHGEWEVKRLGDVCRITTGKKDVNEGNPNGQFPFFTCSRSHTFSDSFSFDTEAILIAGNGEVGNLHYFQGKFEAYQRTYVLLAFSAHVRYLWHQLSAYLGDSLGLGKIGSSIPYIKKENLIGFEFDSPRDASEQTAIASVLTEMDGELAALEQRREKTRALKQAMMQELLTGRTRLVSPKEAHA